MLLKINHEESRKAKKRRGEKIVEILSTYTKYILKCCIVVDQLLELKHTEDFTTNVRLRFDGQEALKDNGDSWITDRSARWFKNRNEGLNVGIGTGKMWKL